MNINPMYVCESLHGQQDLSIKAAMLSSGIILLQQDITPQALTDIYQSMWYANTRSEIQYITLIISSNGGSVMDGLAILDLIKLSGKPVHGICINNAYSMGAILLSACEKGYRCILPHAKVMIHEPSLSNAGGNATSIQETAQDMIATNKMLCQLLAEHTGHPKRSIEKLVRTDKFFTAQEAVEFGLCDRIVSKEEIWIS